jgi:hypothetical protein
MNPHPLKAFFEAKAQLDQQAIISGQTSAVPAEVYPHLASALREALRFGSLPYLGNADESEYLLNAARNMAIFAVWESNPEWLSSGLLALLAEGGRTDPRITMLHLAMLNHAAEKIGVSFKTVTEPMIKLTTSEVAALVTSFNARPAEAKSLESFGYKEVLRRGKFDFKCAW